VANFAESVTEAWYLKKAWIYVFLPLMAVFWLVSILRRLFYRIGILKQTKIPVPVIVVGNISVGGTGKSPLTAYLVKELKRRGFSPGIVSRGYGGKSDTYPLLVSKDSKASEVGDEPVMLYQMTQSPVVVDPIRSRAALKLFNEHSCNVIICDDGLQHYALDRDIEICVIDGQRGLGNGLLLPVGPLRESKKRLRSVNFVIVNGDEQTIEPLINSVGLEKDGVLFGMTLQSADLVNLFDASVLPIDKLKDLDIRALAGIGNPDRFFKALQGLGANVDGKGYSDHHDFVKSDIMFEDDLPVVMTHKDAVKCRSLFNKEQRNRPENLWYMPVAAQINESFIDSLCEKLERVSN
jgi:tetraacyldisaccharide 4'-kinase